MMVKKKETDITELMTVLLFKMEQTKTMVLTDHMEMTELMTTMMAKKKQIKTEELMTVLPVKMAQTEMMVMPD